MNTIHIKVEHKTVVETMAQRCREIRYSGTPLILLNTDDPQLAQEVALCSGIVAPVSKRSFYAKEEEGYYRFLKDAEPQQDLMGCGCSNLYTRWKELEAHLTRGKDGTLPISGEGRPVGLYVLPLHPGNAVSRSRPAGGSEPLSAKCLRAYITERMQEEDPQSKLHSTCILLYGQSDYLPDDLMGQVGQVEEEYPNKWEIREILARMLRGRGLQMHSTSMDTLTQDLTGFSRQDLIRRITALLNMPPVKGRPAITDPDTCKESILQAKAQVLLANGGILELQPSPKGEPSLAGMGNYIKWIKRYTDQMNAPLQYVLERGISSPKGVLLCGVPGCGKSEAAKLLQRTWRTIPLLKLNMDAIMGSYVGQSERNLRRALRQAEAMAPCVIWIDEVEKALSGASSKQSSDNGTTQRMFGRLLNWMQDHTHPCFIFATSNDLSKLPAEFLRKGRFDEVFAVYMPTCTECKAIFKEQMHRAERLREDTQNEQNGTVDHGLFATDCFDDDTLQTIMNVLTEDGRLPQQVKFLSGGDIAELVKTALRGFGKIDRPIRREEWIAAVRKDLSEDSFRTQGSGFAAQNAMSASYLRLMRGGYVHACDPKQLLLDPALYRVTAVWSTEKLQNVIQASYDTAKAAVPADLYDKALWTVVTTGINRLAPQLEEAENKRLAE